MKKLIPLLLLMLICGSAFQACSDSKTYAEMLEDEKKAISDFIKKNSIKVISASEFEKSGNKTDTAKNEYVQFSNGTYVQICDYGAGDSIRNRDVVTVRFVEYDILNKDTILTNYMMPNWLDVFDYTISGTTVYGQFRKGLLYDTYGMSNQNSSQNSTQVPEGWLVPLPYIKSGARVKIIVPSKVGHSSAIRYVHPFFYDLRKILVW